MKYIFCYTLGTGSVSHYFSSLINELSRRGHQITVVSWNLDKSINPKDILRSDVAFYTFPSHRPVKFADFRFFYSLVKEKSPDVIISNFGSVNIALLVGKLLRIKNSIAWYHTLSSQISLDSKKLDLRNKFLCFRKALVYRMATHIFTNSDASIEDCHKTYRVPRPKIIKNYLMVDCDTNIAKREFENVQICFVGRFEKSKGQEDLIRALPAIKAKFAHINVVFLGNGDTLSKQKELAVHLHVDANCDFRGSVPIEEVRQVFIDSYLSVSSSRSEALGLVNIESIAVGTPVVTTGAGGIGEIIKDGINGLYYEAGDYTMLAEKIILLLENQDLYKEFGEAAIRIFNEKFSLKHGLSSLADSYENLTH